ncbi:MAG TPA: GIY-YIG nuclease family protein [Noviherbaspirillum sp.]|uniref:GIY-YIG nuclease family protein n=1 Tax=Noviherbaspirillum sp. TaxID=1926288 RepID=UPI002B45AB15|nr:GIY-YIG nuclease family protein [Noviherbaspirillum sp.]HJV88176.1 GIY-YIG nuclease family protein [Noviherbaspirillum sp.]
MSSNPHHLSPSARRQIARQVRDAFPRMGIYAIRDKETGKERVGSSRNVDGALNRAQFELRMRSHPDKALQAAWDNSGPERFAFDIVDLLKERDDPNFDYAKEMQELEQFYREELETTPGAP